MYFKLNFDELGLKKLIATHYTGNEVSSEDHSYKLELFEYEGEPVRTELIGDGDFASEECVELLKEADIVVTNPPFSLFRDYVKLLMDYEKKFLIIGNKNAITYKNTYNTNDLAKKIKELLQDDDVTKVNGIIPYVLSNRTKEDEKYLSIRTFSEKQKRAAYEKQEYKCPHCLSEGNENTYEFSEMQGDHIIPWSKGGRTVDDNVQMLCKKHNATKSGKY